MNPKAAPNQLRRAVIRSSLWVARARVGRPGGCGVFSLWDAGGHIPISDEIEQRLCQHDCVTTSAAKPRSDG